MLSHAYRFLRGKNIRQGRPRPPWAELVLTEADWRMQTVQETVPAITDLSHPFLFSPPTATEVYFTHGPTVTDWRVNARIYRPVREAARSRALWRTVTRQYPKPVPLSRRQRHYTMDNTTQWSSNCATHNRISLSSSLIGDYTNWGLRMRTRTMTFHIAFRTTLLTGCGCLNHFLQQTLY